MSNFEYGKVFKEHGSKIAIGALLLGASGIAVTAVVRAARRNQHRLEVADGPQADLSFLASPDLSDDEKQTLYRVAGTVIWRDSPDVAVVSDLLGLEEDLAVWALDLLADHGIVESFVPDEFTRYRLTTSMAKVIQDSALNETRNPELVAAIYELQPPSGSS